MTLFHTKARQTPDIFSEKENQIYKITLALKYIENINSNIVLLIFVIFMCHFIQIYFEAHITLCLSLYEKNLIIHPGGRLVSKKKKRERK